MTLFSLKHRVRRPLISKRERGSLAEGKHPLLIMLHGVGGHEDVLYAVSQYFDPRFFVISVRAPFEQSSSSFAWYRISPFLNEKPIFAEDSEISRQNMVEFLHEAVANYEVDPSQVYLFGYGQGATISLSLLMTEPNLIRCVVAISGEILPEVMHFRAGDAKIAEVPVFLAYGLHDQVIPISVGRHTRDTLARMTSDLNYREYASGHELSPNMLHDGTAWLTIKLNEARLSWRRANAPLSRLSHIQLKVRDLDRSIVFYKKYLGLNLTERVGKVFAFLSSGYHHHELALQAVGLEALDIPPNTVGLLNLAFEVTDKPALALIYKKLVDAGMAVRTANHIISWSIYFYDPDGHELEVFCDTRYLVGAADYWQGRDIALTPESILSFLPTHEDDNDF
jgi:phospholipase/carboxylesterase